MSLLQGRGFANRGFADGTEEQQLTGLIGQTVIHDLLGVERPLDLGRSDRGVDLIYRGVRIDVKTIGRGHDPMIDWVNNVSGLQIHYDTDVYVFCSLNKRMGWLHVCGWITKACFIEQAVFSPAGTLCRRSNGTAFRAKADLYEIKNVQLVRPQSVSALRASLGPEGVENRV